MTRWTRRDDRALREHTEERAALAHAHAILRSLGIDPDTVTVHLVTHRCTWRCRVRRWWRRWGAAVDMGLGVLALVVIILAVTR